jgi:hypothetical protein
MWKVDVEEGVIRWTFRVADYTLEALALALRTIGCLSGNLTPNGQFPHLDR